MAYVYIVRCEDGSLYTGIARDLRRRMRQHYYKKKSAAKYTRSRHIQSLEMVWEAPDWSAAARLEFWIKRLSKVQKEALILQPERLAEIDALAETASWYTPRPEWTLEECLGDGEA